MCDCVVCVSVREYECVFLWYVCVRVCDCIWCVCEACVSVRECECICVVYVSVRECECRL